MNYKLKPINEISESDLYNFLLDIDAEIVPPMSSRINLKEYPKKIKELSIGKVLLNENEIISMSIYYPPNKDDNFIYWTLIAIKKEYRGKNLSHYFFEEIISEAKARNASGVKVQTWDTAHKLIKLYKQMGFDFYDTLDNRGNGVKSVLLKIEF